MVIISTTEVVFAQTTGICSSWLLTAVHSPVDQNPGKSGKVYTYTEISLNKIPITANTQNCGFISHGFSSRD